MEALRRASVRLEAARARVGVARVVGRAAATLAAGVAFVRLYLVPTHANRLPDRVLRTPVW